VTATYVTLMSISTAIPALSAAPVADSLGWRTSLGMWSVTAAIAAVPWVLIYVRRHHERPGEPAPIIAVPERIRGLLWRSRTAWAIALTFGATSFSAYAMFAWLPTLLVDTAGVSRVEAGALLALYSFVAVPGSILAPILVVRLRHPAWIIHAGVASFLIGYAGMLLAPTVVPWLWVAFAGMGPILFPVALTLINVRTHSQQTSTALSGFVQGIGYTLAAFSPPLIGALHEASGGWTLPIIVLSTVSAVAIVTGISLGKPRFVEQDFEASARS
jgi:MFS transporter, CP family, cyanate transporter